MDDGLLQEQVGPQLQLHPQLQEQGQAHPQLHAQEQEQLHPHPPRIV